MKAFSYIAEKSFNYIVDNKRVPITFRALEDYKKNIESIRRKKDWKSQGESHFLMADPFSQVDELEHSYITDVFMKDSSTVIYTARLYDGSAVYSKPLLEGIEAESLILRKENIIIHDVDYEPNKQRLALACGAIGTYEKHISILGVESGRLQEITEGKCMDSNPTFDKKNGDILYYDSCGFGYDERAGLLTGPREINKLNLSTGDLDTLIGDDNNDYFKLQMDADGNLYCLKRPYKGKKHAGMSLKDMAMVPVKLVRAIFSWLDFFTQRYTGDSLKKTTGGNNPAKLQQKSPEDIFIEGNLIESQKMLNINKQAGDKFPGTIPKSWELVKINADGNTETIEKGVLSFLITDDVLLFSNGKHLLQHKNGETSLLQEDKLISKVRYPC